MLSIFVVENANKLFAIGSCFDDLGGQVKLRFSPPPFQECVDESQANTAR